VHGAIFAFPPIAIPVDDDGKVSYASDAKQAHYATIVLLADENNAPAVFEFPQDVFDGLAAYAKRHGDLSSIEILLSREADSGKIRMRIGASQNTPEDVTITASSYQSMYDSLYDKYMLKIGKQLSDI
jgi:hypothetical protein